MSWVGTHIKVPLRDLKRLSSTHLIGTFFYRLDEWYRYQIIDVTDVGILAVKGYPLSLGEVVVEIIDEDVLIPARQTSFYRLIKTKQWDVPTDE